LAGGEAVTATLVLTAVAEVGTALTVVGAVTGNKDLMKIGGVMSLVGGVGGLIAGAGDAAGVAAEGVAGNAAQEGFRASEIAAENAGEGALTDAATSAATDVGGAVQAEQAVAPAANVAQTAQGPIDANPAQTAATSTPDSLNAPQAAQTQAAQSADPNAISTPQGVQQVQAQTPADVATPYGNTPQETLRTSEISARNAAPQSSGSFWSSILKFANDNSKLLNTATTLVGGALKGASEADMFQQKLQFQRDQWNRANSAGTYAPTTRGIVQGVGV
jgi:hypothetical protein